MNDRNMSSIKKINESTATKVQETESKIEILKNLENMHQKATSNKIMEQELKKLERDSLRIITVIDQILSINILTRVIYRINKKCIIIIVCIFKYKLNKF
ncbi:hypothetical protein PUN28_000148 [Cardiocondyla obscurior]|uniref:Uncharacterized protein n=1 Tax=Cardiocondyla obscurior TaxID=286306 RepID=A0AAW2GYB2_9HYME